MYVSSATRARGRRRTLVVVVVLAVIVGVLAVGTGALAFAGHDALPARTVVGGVDVGRMSRDDAAVALGVAARRQRLRPVVLRTDAPDTDIQVTVTGALLGAQPRIEDALDEADRSGTFSRLTRRLGLGETEVIPLRFDFDALQLERLKTDLDTRIATAPQDATVNVTAGGATVEPSVVGRALDGDALVRRLRLLPSTVTVPIDVVPPDVATAAARRAGRTADALLSTTRTVAIGTTAVKLAPPFLRRALVIEPAGRNLMVRLDADVLRRRLDPAFRDRLRKSRDAQFRVEGKRVAVLPSAPGRELDVRAIGRSLLANPRSTVHRARFRSVAPALTTEEARGLGIKELVSEFTTYYPCCAPRVTNIQRGAEILDGTIVRAGGTFSLNEALGMRTEERGFVFAPQILAGRLEDAVGGGVSQISTTLYNAAFFAGLRLDAFQPHEFYISRYPMGREATVSWGGPEMIFTNDWKAGLLIKVSAWSTGISVRFYSSKLGRRVETVTEDPYSYVQPKTRVTRNPALKPGERKVVQEAGPSGFTVEYTRKVYRGDKLIKDERYRTRYKAENEFVEVGPPKKKPKPGTKPEVPPKPGADDASQGGETDTDAGTTTTTAG
jgi:vancomycin resistance protein YoaR